MITRDENRYMQCDWEEISVSEANYLHMDEFRANLNKYDSL